MLVIDFSQDTSHHTVSLWDVKRGDFGEFLVFFQVLRILFRRCGFDSLIGIHIEDILGNQIQW